MIGLVVTTKHDSKAHPRTVIVSGPCLHVQTECVYMCRQSAFVGNAPSMQRSTHTSCARREL